MLEIFLIFTRLGCICFGGPIALIAIMEQEFCHKRKWFSREEFNQTFAICKLLPGPVAVQTGIYLAYRKYGRLAGILAGIGITFPALLMVLGLSYVYVTYGSNNSNFALISNFMQNTALAIIILVSIDLGKIYIKNWASSMLLLVSGTAIFFLPTWEPVFIIGFGLLGVFLTFRPRFTKHLPIVLILNNSSWQGMYALLIGSKVLALFWICFKASELIFGTGLAIIPMLQGELVTHLHWLSNKQFIDGITAGQVTPGPVSSSVVFFGYVISGLPGAIACALGFYIPPFINTLIILPIFWNKIIASRYLQVFSLWAFPAIIGGIAGAAIKIGISSLNDKYAIITLTLSLIIMYKKLIPAWLLIPLSGLCGTIIVHLTH